MMDHGRTIYDFPEVIYSLELVTSRKQGREGVVRCPCPAHEHGDRVPSARVWVGREGNLCWHCFKGCDWKTCCAVAGIPKTAWFVNDPNQYKKAYQRKAQPRMKILKRYPYHDEKGKVLFEIVRTDIPGRKFLSRQPIGNGWAWSLAEGTFVEHPQKPGNWQTLSEANPANRANAKQVTLPAVRRVLYDLPELLRSDTFRVFVCEGEKDAETLKELGVVATTCPHGANHWEWTYSKTLAGKDVVIVPDMDRTGVEKGWFIAGSLMGFAKSITLLSKKCGFTLPNVHEGKKDITDYMDAVCGTDHGVPSLANRRTELETLVARAATWAPVPEVADPLFTEG